MSEEERVVGVDMSEGESKSVKAKAVAGGWMLDDIAQAEEVKDDTEAHAKRVAQLEDVVAKFKAARKWMNFKLYPECKCELCNAIRALDAID
jgi:hypothetical protein